jgi:hypothetical protein
VVKLTYAVRDYPGARNATLAAIRDVMVDEAGVMVAGKVLDVVRHSLNPHGYFLARWSELDDALYDL